MARDGTVVTSSGRVFQTPAAATANVLSPTVDSRHRRIASNEDDDDRRRDRVARSETGKYHGTNGVEQ